MKVLLILPKGCGRCNVVPREKISTYFSACVGIVAKAQVSAADR